MPPKRVAAKRKRSTKPDEPTAVPESVVSPSKSASKRKTTTSKPVTVTKAKRKSVIVLPARKATATSRRKKADPDQQIEELRAKLRELLKLKDGSNQSSSSNTIDDHDDIEESRTAPSDGASTSSKVIPRSSSCEREEDRARGRSLVGRNAKGKTTRETVSISPTRRTGINMWTDSRERANQPALMGARLGTFDGSTNLDIFLAKFRNCADYFNWNPRDQVFQLKHSLEGAAALVVHELSSDCLLEDLISVLSVRFGSQYQSERYRAEMRARRRRPNETLQSLYQDLCRLKSLAFGVGPANEFSEIYLRDIFVDALNDPELRKQILLQEPKTMETALSIASRVEAIDLSNNVGERYPRNQGDRGGRAQENRFRSVTDSKEEADDSASLERQMAEMRGALEDVQEQLALQRQNVQLSQSRGRAQLSDKQVASLPELEETVAAGPLKSLPERRTDRGRASGFAPRACYSCNSTTHLARDCPRNEKNTNKGRWEAKPRKIRTFDPPNHVTILREMKKGEAYIEIQLNDRSVNALLDTGCDFSVCGRRLIPYVALRSTTRTLYTADGTALPLLGETTLSIGVNGFWVAAEVAVTEVVDGLILGIDWLTKNKCQWNFETSKFAIYDVEVETIPRRAKQSVRRLIVQDDVILPA